MQVRELQDGCQIATALVVRSTEVRRRREGDEYLKLTLGDRTGSVPAVVLDAVAEARAVCRTGEVVHVTGSFSVHPQYGGRVLVEELLGTGSLDVRLIRSRSVREALGELPGEIDCVLLDLGLPDGFGMDTVARVRAAAPEIAVIVLTGLANEAAGETAVNAGAQDYLVKGQVDGALLARAIRYALGRRHAEDIQRQLRLAEIHAEENARLARGLRLAVARAPEPCRAHRRAPRSHPQSRPAELLRSTTVWPRWLDG